MNCLAEKEEDVRAIVKIDNLEISSDDEPVGQLQNDEKDRGETDIAHFSVTLTPTMLRKESESGDFGKFLREREGEGDRAVYPSLYSSLSPTRTISNANISEVHFPPSSLSLDPLRLEEQILFEEREREKDIMFESSIECTLTHRYYC